MTNTPVLIAGAGPTGLILALWLKKRGINFRIIDQNEKPGSTSRAIAIQARTLEFYRQLGINKKLIENGVVAEQLTLRRRGKAVAHAQFGSIGKNLTDFPYLLFCPQDIHEEMLCDELKKLNVEVERNTKLTGFKQNAKEVTATLQSLKGEEQITVDYLCGCDGAHSIVRHDLPTDFPGGTYSQVFFVADVIAEGDAAQDGVQISFSPKDFCIVMPVKKKGSIRLTGVVPPESETKEKITFDDVAESVRRNTGLNVKSVSWFSSYHVHHRMAEHFQMNRIFLAGDAAHIHSPAGGQGMNTGIGDAVNLAWKLADVIDNNFSARLLKSYSIERMAFARWLLHNTDRAFRLIASRSWIGSIFRTYILPTLFATLTRFHFFLKFFFRTVSQTRIRYRESFLSAGVAGELHGGDRLPWVQLHETDNHRSLQSLDWQVHVYGKVRSEFMSSITAMNLKIHQFEFNQDAHSKGILKDAFYLIRPDGYIAYASSVQNAEEISKYYSKLK